MTQVQLDIFFFLILIINFFNIIIRNISDIIFCFLCIVLILICFMFVPSFAVCCLIYIMVLYKISRQIKQNDNNLMLNLKIN